MRSALLLAPHPTFISLAQSLLYCYNLGLELESRLNGVLCHQAMIQYYGQPACFVIKLHCARTLLTVSNATAVAAMLLARRLLLLLSVVAPCTYTYCKNPYRYKHWMIFIVAKHIQCWCGHKSQLLTLQCMDIIMISTHGHCRLQKHISGLPA